MPTAPNACHCDFYLAILNLLVPLPCTTQPVQCWQDNKGSTNVLVPHSWKGRLIIVINETWPIFCVNNSNSQIACHVETVYAIYFFFIFSLLFTCGCVTFFFLGDILNIHVRNSLLRVIQYTGNELSQFDSLKVILHCYLLKEYYRKHTLKEDRARITKNIHKNKIIHHSKTTVLGISYPAESSCFLVSRWESGETLENLKKFKFFDWRFALFYHRNPALIKF